MHFQKNTTEFGIVLLYNILYRFVLQVCNISAAAKLFIAIQDANKTSLTVIFYSYFDTSCLDLVLVWIRQL